MANHASKAKYGNVLLKDDEARKYAVINDSTDLQTVLNAWQLNRPSVVFFVIDRSEGSKSHYESLSNEIERIVTEGLVKTVENNDSWIISSGLEKNTPRFLSRAIANVKTKSAKMVSIGITGLQNLDTKDMLTRNALEFDDHNRAVVDHQLGQHASHFLLMESSKSSFLDQDELVYWKLKQTARHMFKPFPLPDVPVTFLILPGYECNLQTLQLAVKYEPITVLSGHKETTKLFQAVEDVVNLHDTGSNDQTTRIYKEWYMKSVHTIITTMKPCITVCEVHVSDKPEDIRKYVIDSLSSKYFEQMTNTQDAKSKIAILLDDIKIAKDISPLTKNKLFSYLLQKVNHEMSDIKYKLFLNLLQKLENTTLCTKNKLFSNLLQKLKSITPGKVTDEQLMTKYLLGSCHHMHVWLNEGMDRSDLFIRSILLNEQELAKRIWMNGEDKIITAVLGYVLLEAMAKNVRSDDVRNKLQNDAREFNDMAIEELSHCYNDDENSAHSLLLKQSVHAKCTKAEGNLGLLEFAHKSYSREFISQAACQTLLDKLWFGKISPNNGNMKLIMCLIIPLLVLLKIEFDDGEKQGSNKQKLSIGKKFIHFYRAPVIKFFSHTLFYLIFLGLYSYYLLIQLNEEFSYVDVVLTIWISTFLLEELFEIYNSTSCKNVLVMLHSYLVDYWNILDFFAILVYAVGTSIRYAPYENSMDVARVVLAINLLMFYFRLLHIFSVHRKMGPQLLIMAKMIEDLMYFMTIMAVIMVAFAVSSYSITHPNSIPSGQLFFDIFKHAFWNLFGEIFLEDIQLSEPYCTRDLTTYNNSTLPRCPTDFGIYVGTVLIGFYSIVCIILMLNLLIAMFNYSVQIIHEKNDVYWKYQQYGLVKEYCKRLVFPPPLTPLALFAHCTPSPSHNKKQRKSIHSQFLEQYLVEEKKS